MTTIPAAGWPEGRGYEIHRAQGGLNEGIRLAITTGGSDTSKQQIVAEDHRMTPERAAAWIEKQRREAWLREPVLNTSGEAHSPTDYEISMTAQMADTNLPWSKAKLALPNQEGRRVPSDDPVSETERQEALIRAISRELVLANRIIADQARKLRAFKDQRQETSHRPEGLPQHVVDEIAEQLSPRLRLALESLTSEQMQEPEGWTQDEISVVSRAFDRAGDACTLVQAVVPKGDGTHTERKMIRRAAVLFSRAAEDLRSVKESSDG